MRCSLFITVWRIFFKSFSVSKCLLLFFLLSLRIQFGTGVEHQTMEQEVPGSPPASLSFFFFVFWKWILKKLNQTMMKTLFEFDEIKVCIKSSNVRIIFFKLWIILFKNLKSLNRICSNFIMIWCNFTIPWMVFITSIIKEWITSLHL